MIESSLEPASHRTGKQCSSISKILASLLLSGVRGNSPGENGDEINAIAGVTVVGAAHPTATAIFCVWQRRSIWYAALPKLLLLG